MGIESEYPSHQPEGNINHLAFVPLVNSESEIDEGLLEEQMERIKNQLKVGFESLLKESLTNSYIKESGVKKSVALQFGKCEVDLRDTDRLSSHLQNFGKDQSIGPRFEISATIWEKGKEDETPVLSIDRSIFFDRKTKEWKVYRSQMLIPKEHQGKGIGGIMLSGEEKIYKEEGIKEILLMAGEPVGLYNNARLGFDFSHPEVKNKVNQNFIKFVLETQKEMFITKISIGNNNENVLPIKREFSAQELSQMRAYDESGKEFMFNARRPKEYQDLSIVSNEIAEHCFSVLPIPPTTDVKRELMIFWNPDTFFMLKRSENISQEVENLFQQQLSWLIPSVSKEIKSILSNTDFKNAFVSYIENLSSDRITDIERYPLGKAFFLDVGRKDYLPSWYGKKRIA